MAIAAAIHAPIATRMQRRARVEESATTEEREDRDASWWIGRVIGERHRIIRHIATGGMGHVFLAQHVRLGGYAAVKVLLSNRDEHALRYFANEARVLSHLKHPNIVGIADCGVQRGGGCYIVMEWLSGTDLGSYITQHGPLSPTRTLWVLTQLASAIDYVHSQGFVHRDIKPDNVIFHPDAYDAVKLFDFGVAVPFRTPPRSEMSKLIGTPLYMAPEQAAGQPASPSTDLYALGALALELLTGEAPYERVSAAEVVMSVLTQPPKLPSDYGLNIPGLDAVLAKALARDPEQRFHSALELVVALREVIERSDAPALSLDPEIEIAVIKPSRPSLRPTVVWQDPVERYSTPKVDVSAPTLRAARRRPKQSSALAKVAAFCFGVAAWLLAT